MTTVVLDDVTILVGDLDIKSQSNQVRVAAPVEALDKTVFGNNTRINIGGLEQGDMSAEGFVDYTDGGLDERIFEELGIANDPMTIIPLGEVEGGIGYAMKALLSKYEPGAAVGELMAFTVEASAASSIVRGTILQVGTETASGQSTARQIGEVSATQKLYASLHVLSFTGTSLDVVVRSDDNSGMTTPTTRITFTQATDKTSEWATPVSGAIADDYWDIDFTIVGGGASIKFIVLVAIQ